MCGSQVIHQQTLGEQAHGTNRAGTRPDKVKTKPGHPTMRSADGQSLQTKRAAPSLLPLTAGNIHFLMDAGRSVSAAEVS